MRFPSHVWSVESIFHFFQYHPIKKKVTSTSQYIRTSHYITINITIIIIISSIYYHYIATSITMISPQRVCFAIGDPRQAALSRQKRMEALEAPSSSSARRRGVWHEARHVAKVRRLKMKPLFLFLGFELLNYFRLSFSWGLVQDYISSIKLWELWTLKRTSNSARSTTPSVAAWSLPSLLRSNGKNGWMRWWRPSPKSQPAKSPQVSILSHG